MNTRFTKMGLLIAIIVGAVIFQALQVAGAQDTPIIGYPYETNGGESSGCAYSFYGARFTLNGTATITSISAKLAIYWNWQEPSAVSHFRFAIYSDKNGSIDSLIGQTEIGSGNVPVNGPCDDRWRTLNLESAVSLNPGSYWLITVDDTQQVGVHDQQPLQQNAIVLGGLDSMEFPATLNQEEIDMAPEMYAIYASGQGASSVLPPPPPSNSPLPSHVILSAMTINSAGTAQITGSLIANNTGVPLANMTFAYRSISEPDLHQIATVTTDSNGHFAVDWQPPASGSYVINATYYGSESYGPEFEGVNVLVTGDKTPEAFSFESNSTVTGIQFNPDNSELNLSVTGQSGTTGFVDLYVSKSLVENISAIQAYVDGNPVSYTVTSTEDSWILHFDYHHSSHNIIFKLGKLESSNSEKTVPELPETVIPLIILGIVALTLTTIAMKRK